MAKTFRESTLRVGTHHSPDGAVIVTPDRLKGWAKSSQSRSNAGRVAPMHWDHSTNVDQHKPVSLNVFNRRERSVENRFGLARASMLPKTVSQRRSHLRVAIKRQSITLNRIALSFASDPPGIEIRDKRIESVGTETATYRVHPSGGKPSSCRTVPGKTFVASFLQHVYPRAFARSAITAGWRLRVPGVWPRFAGRCVCTLAGPSRCQ